MEVLKFQKHYGNILVLKKLRKSKMERPIKERVIIETINLKIEKNYRRLVLEDYRKTHPIRASVKDIYYRLTRKI
jgi:hypothetical protein